VHFYQFNIKDYQSHTGHLDDLEDLAYRRLLDWAYLHETPIPLDPEQAARQIRMRPHAGCIATVLSEFFERTAEGWVSKRVQQEIEAVGAKKEKARASANARWNANALPTVSEGIAPMTHTHDPLPNLNTEAKASLSGRFPDCPQQEILNLWKKHLPHLTQPRSWEGTRRANLKARWAQAAKPSLYSPEGYKTRQDGLAWWDGFLGYIANDTRLAVGFESNGRSWKPDLEWIVNATNFQKIIDGKYNK
jgi:uncharacterized protein YdaU (DUF1376 family)